MEQRLFLLTLLCTTYAAQQGDTAKDRVDLSEKLFAFPLDKGTSNVKLFTSVEQPITALTLCMRFFSSLTRGQSLFSLAVPSNDNAFLLYKPQIGVYRLHVNGMSLDIHGLPDVTDEWNSVCWTWDSSNGFTTLWINGKRSPRKILEPKATLTGAPSIILGQEQDSYGGGFDPNQSFIGDITDVHLWNSAISPCEIRSFMEGSAFVPGNVLNWKNLQYSITDSVYVENSDFDKLICY